jgi:hypothetical protein
MKERKRVKKQKHVAGKAIHPHALVERRLAEDEIP